VTTNPSRVQEAIEKSLSNAKFDITNYGNVKVINFQNDKEKKASRNYNLKQAIKTIDRTKMSYKIHTEFSLRRHSKLDNVNF
jgi:hypothetical protein